MNLNVNQWLYTISKYLLCIFIGVMSVVIIGQVLSRTFISYSFPWAEELARFLLIWITFLGASVAFYEKQLAAFDLLERKLSGTWKPIHHIAIHLMILLFLGVVFVYGIQLVLKPSIQLQRSPGLGLPLFYTYLSIPAGAFIMIFYSIGNLARIVKRKEPD